MKNEKIKNEKREMQMSIRNNLGYNDDSRKSAKEVFARKI